MNPLDPNRGFLDTLYEMWNAKFQRELFKSNLHLSLFAIRPVSRSPSVILSPRSAIFSSSSASQLPSVTPNNICAPWTLRLASSPSPKGSKLPNMTLSSQQEPFSHSPIRLSSQTLQSFPPEPSLSAPVVGPDSGVVSYPLSGTLTNRSEYVDASTFNFGELLREIQRLGHQLAQYE